MKLTKTCAKFLRKHGGTLLAIGASIGVVVTAIETGKATVKAEKLIEMNRIELEVTEGITLTNYSAKEKVQDCWKFYIPAAVAGAGTIACILGSNALNKKQLASMTAAYMALGKTYQEYRRQVAQQVGAEKEAAIRDAARNDISEEHDKNGDVVRLFYEPATKRYFHATMADVIEASYYFNRRLATDGYISVNEWCNYICSDELPHLPDGDERGWCIDQLIADYDAYWMDFEYDVQTTDDGLECYYLAPFLDPVEDYLNYDPANHPF